MSRSTRITLVCHGTTQAMKSAGFAADEPLLETENANRAILKASLAHAKRLVSAPELRSRQSAQALDFSVTIDSVVRDIDYGRWAGKSLADVEANEPEGLMAWIADIDAAPHGGESVASLLARIAAWLDGQRTAGGHSIVITHPSVIRAALVSILDAPRESFWKIDVRPWSTMEMTSDGRRWALRSFGLVTG